MTMKLQSLLHFRTDIKDKLPQSNEIELGEIAINHASDGETLFIKNSDNEIAEFKDTKYYSKITDDIYSKLDTIDETIEENELVIASSLNDLNDRALALEEAMETNIADIEQLSVDFAELDKTVEDNKTETDTKLQEVTQRIEKDELVTAAGLTDLNNRVTVIENGEIENPYFKSFATLSEYETAVASGEVVYPCVSFIEESSAFKFMTNVVYNAVVTLSEEYVTMMGQNFKTLFGGYPLCFSDYFDSVIVDGVEMIDSAETFNVEGLSMNVIKFPSEEIGTSYNVSFKVKEEPEILLAGNDNEFTQLIPFCAPFYCVLSYIEIDESFHRRGLSSDSGKYYNFSYMFLSLNRDLHIKFKGDYYSILHENVPGLYMLLYGQLMLIGDPNINVNVILSIPSDNATYGTPDDVFVLDDSSTHTFYAEYNWLKTTIDENANFNVSVLTY